MTSAAYGAPVYQAGARSNTSFNSTLGQYQTYINDDAAAGPIPAYNNATGIDVFAWTCRHEAQHVDNDTAWWGATPLPGTTSPYDPSKDLDGDYIPDALEKNLGMKFHPDLGGYDPTKALTPNLADEFGYGPGFNDNEDYTQRMQRQNHPWVNGSADKEDWANPGHQKK